MAGKRDLWIVIGLWAGALAISLIAPNDHLTWFMEVLPVLVAMPLMAGTQTTFPLSRILMWAIFAHGLILILGGHYTYAEVPLGRWLQDLFGFERNHYDRIGHFAQGFVPALLTREILLRKTPINTGKILFVLAVGMPLAFSAFYEIIEWWTAIALDQNATAFLGTQGDPWDTQWDMFMALVGAIVALMGFSGLQDRQLSVYRALN